MPRPRSVTPTTWGDGSARAALAADLLVELDPVALLGRLAALLAAHPADLSEEVVAVALLRGLPSFAPGLGSAHLLRFRHPTTSSPIRLPWLFVRKPLEMVQEGLAYAAGMPELSPAQRQALGALVNAAPFAKVVRDLGRRFEANGHELYLVGGTVRDALLDRSSPDIDLTTDATPDQILAVVRARRWSDGVWLQGVRYGTVGVRKGDFRLEITTFRSDTYREDSRKPEVTFGRSIDEDLARRDFSVNAMAMKLPDGPFVDPHGGLADLAAKRLRTPSSPEVSFDDDPLRMLRAARFASQLELVPTPETLAAISGRRGRLQIVSRERIRDELSKLLLGRAPAKGLWLAVNTGLANEFLPELPALALEQDPVHRHKDVLRHTIAVVERATALDADEPDLTLRMAALLHDIGKPRTRKVDDEGVSFHLHEVVGAKMAERRLTELRYP